MKTNQITLTDMFCGCGGSSQGAKMVAGVEVKYALNHWKLAIESHNTNHPDTHHDCADISETHPARYSRTTGLIASPECTNHGLAKGQRRKNLNQQEFFQTKAIDPSAIRSRATMWDVPRFAEIHDYEFIITENVVEVRYWVMFEAWLKAMHSLGYNHECVYLNSMFAHGEGITGFAPQSRDRIYIVFWKKGNPKPDLNIRPKAPCKKCGVVEAFQSWKPNRRAGKYKTQYVYRCSTCNEVVTPFYYAALNAIDLTIPIVRIGDREKFGKDPLSEKTIARIEYGLKKYGARPTIIDQRNQSGSVQSRIRLAEQEVLNTQATGYSSYLFSPFVFNITRSKAKSDRSVEVGQVLPTIVTKQELALVSPFLLNGSYGGRTIDMKEPINTQTTQESTSLVIPFMGVHRSKGNTIEVTDPIGTVSAGGVHSSLILAPYHGKHQASLITDPTPTVPTKDSISLIDMSPKIEDCYFRMLEPIETALAQGFPPDYVILGSKKTKQKQIGNANPPPTMELLVARCVETLK